MNNQPVAVNSCGPCLTEKQLKKKNAEFSKELKATINSLCTMSPYQKESQQVIGELVVRLVQLHGPLK
jgi:hypothetical protein